MIILYRLHLQLK